MIEFQFKKVIEEHKEELAAAKKNQEQALETIQVNIQWQKKHADEIKNILPKYYKKI